MPTSLIAKSRVTIVRQSDPYAVVSSLKEFVFTTEKDGSLNNAVSFSCEIQVFQGKQEIKDFTIKEIIVPTGFSSIEADNTTKTVLFHAGPTEVLADSGILMIPVRVGETIYKVGIAWSKARRGATGEDANMLDWVKDWNNNKTTINSEELITPKIFSGVKNADHTLTGTAIGRFELSVIDEAGSVKKETIDGVYGFKNGRKTFSLNNIGDVQFGNGSESILYDARTGKIVFGESVRLNWIGSTYVTSSGVFTGLLSAETIKGISISASQITAGFVNTDRIAAGSIDASKLNAGSIKADIINVQYINGLTCTFSQGTIGGWTISLASLEAKNPISGHKILIENTGYVHHNNGKIDLWALKPDGGASFSGGQVQFSPNGSGYLSNGRIKWDVGGNVSVEGNITAKSGKISGFNISGNSLENNAANSSIRFSALMGNAYLYINSDNALLNMRADSARTGISIQTYATGAVGLYINSDLGSKYAIKSIGSHLFGQRSADTWNAPGILYIGEKTWAGKASYFKKLWGDGVKEMGFVYFDDDHMEIKHYLGHTDYTVLVIGWGFPCIGYIFNKTENVASIRVLNLDGTPYRNCFSFILIGRNCWA